MTARGQHNAIHSNSNSNSGNIASEYCKKNVLDIIPLEVQVVNAYLDQKIATLRSVIAAGKIGYTVHTFACMYLLELLSSNSVGFLYVCDRVFFDIEWPIIFIVVIIIGCCIGGRTNTRVEDIVRVRKRKDLSSKSLRQCDGGAGIQEEMDQVCIILLAPISADAHDDSLSLCTVFFVLSFPFPFAFAFLIVHILYHVCSGNVREVFSGYGAERSDYDPDDDDNYYSPHGTSSHYHPGGQTDAFNRFPSSSSPSGLTGQRYSEYLFQELCGRLLDTYSEMIRSLTLQQQQLLLLSQNQTQTQTQTQQPVQPKRPQLQANPSPPISKQYQQNINDALAQALAEYEYFKVIDFYAIMLLRPFANVYTYNVCMYVFSM